MSSVQRGKIIEMAEAVLAAAVAVLVVWAFWRQTRIAPAIAIGAVVAFAELALAQARRDRQHLNRVARELSRANEDLTARVGDLNARLAGLARAHAASEGTLPPRDDPTVAPPREHVDAPAVPAPLRQFITSDRRLDDPQCPSCGRFFVDGPLKGSSTYQCRACGASWPWQRGAPWPDIAVVPDLRVFRRETASPT